MTNATYIYALPNATDSEGVFEMLRYVNTVSDGIFFPIILLVIFCVVFISGLAISTPSKAWTFTSFFCAILVIPLAVMSLIAVKYMYLLGLLLGVGIVWITLENRG